MSSSCVTTVSSCNNYSISRICIPNIFQGDNETIQLTLLSLDGTAIDLNNITGIELLLSGLDADYYLQYTWPNEINKEPIDILQKNEGTLITDKGVISIFIPASFTTHLTSGNLFASIRITKDSLITGRSEIITFDCIQIANIKYTAINVL